ncbi:MAG TPA: NADH-quinone oxidoreductase subunit A [Haliangiales bacterium]|nr:NADH-quinone oxidoreductase subunit A [Haliangiales bacterium]
MELSQYIPGALTILLGVGFAGLLMAAAMFLGPKHESPEKLSPFECGMDPIGSPRARFSVKFYHVAILFLVFDVESAFMYPWAVWFRGAPTLLGLVEMALFVVVLVVALAYVWRKKAIGWD